MPAPPLGSDPAIDSATASMLNRIPASFISARSSSPQLVAPFWMAGVLILYVRGLVNWVAARRLRHVEVCVPPDSIAAAFVPARAAPRVLLDPDPPGRR